VRTLLAGRALVVEPVKGVDDGALVGFHGCEE
jgi:hypothetical protein